MLIFTPVSSSNSDDEASQVCRILKRQEGDKVVKKSM